MTELLARLADFFARPTGTIALDFVDVGIVAYVIYRVLLLMKGTRAMQMGVGLALVFVLYQAARMLELLTLFTMMDSMLTYVVLIIVVVFQNDIRRALARFGSRPWIRGVGNAQETHVIEEVIKAALLLAQKRVGALIVFERDASLEEFLDEGTEIDAGVSKELLYSIFIPSFENPLHDGAVVIRDRRVWKAGCFLPLTASPKLDKTLGTRHRAAIGITEETDAVVVIVSEEKGSVSLCFNGNMVRNLDASSLREAMLGLFYKRKPAKKPGERTSLAPGRPGTGANVTSAAGVGAPNERRESREPGVANDRRESREPSAPPAAAAPTGAATPAGPSAEESS
jgi:uncharacterized protein (TIGR00159 family)